MQQQRALTAQVEILKDGPYQVSGGLPLSRQTIGTNAGGESVQWVPGKSYEARSEYALCRCGHSASKPFCDGSHTKAHFVGTEVASRAPYQEQAETTRGPAMSLTDAQALCAFARFCDTHGQIWNLVHRTNEPSAARHFVAQAGNCPSGRLVAWDNASGQPIEPKFDPSIALIEDPIKGCSGPLWLTGGVQLIGADGFRYQVRNRVTLCRCGASNNKPFCDGTHASIGFTDSK